MKTGYARVSSEGQKLDIQLEQLKDADCAKIYKEKQSGADDKRPVLARCLKSLKAGDVLVFASLDRVARSTSHLLDILSDLDSRGVKIRSLSQSWADTTTPEGRLMITVFAGLAEFERELVKERTSRGIEAARKRGVKFGRKPKLTKHQRKEAIKMLEDGKSGAEVARLFGVSESTVSRLRK